MHVLRVVYVSDLKEKGLDKGGWRKGLNFIWEKNAWKIVDLAQVLHSPGSTYSEFYKTTMKLFEKKDFLIPLLENPRKALEYQTRITQTMK